LKINPKSLNNPHHNKITILINISKINGRIKYVNVIRRRQHDKGIKLKGIIKNGYNINRGI